MRKIPKSLMCLAALLGLLMMSSPASATLLAPGTTVTPGPAVGSFMQVATTGPLAFNFNGNSGTVEELVGHFSTNPFGAVNYTFLYQFTVTSGNIEQLKGSSYASFLTDVVQAPGDGAPGGTTPVGPLGTGTRFALSAQRTPDGSLVTFNFSPAVIAGETSYVLLVNTNASGYGAGDIILVDGGSQTLGGFAPTPEPTSMVLFAGTMIFMGGAAGWRRKRKASSVS